MRPVNFPKPLNFHMNFTKRGWQDLVKTELMDAETIQNCRVACDALMELCYGDERKNIAGWRGVWNDVAMYKER